MDKKEIIMDGSVIGQAAIEEDGLYASIRCLCHFPEKRIYSVFLRCGENDKLLGTCIPQSGGYVLETKIPKKYLQGDKTAFYAAEKNRSKNSMFIPLNPGEPVNCIGELAKTVFLIKNGMPGLAIMDDDQPRNS